MKKIQEQQHTFPMRINKYVAWKNGINRREADLLIKQQKIFINGKHAALGDKVNKDDTVDYKFRGKHIA